MEKGTWQQIITIQYGNPNYRYAEHGRGVINDKNADVQALRIRHT